MTTMGNTNSIFENEIDEGEIMIEPYEVDSLPNDYNISVLINFIERGFLKIPSFQRNYVWKRDMASKFIESIIIGLPIPQVFLFEQARNDFLVIDGQQRLVSIYLFKKKRFPKNDAGRAIIRKYLSLGKEIPDNELSGDNFETFSLKLPYTADEGNSLNGRNYDTLPSSKSYDFKASFDFNRTIRTITIKQVAPDDNCSSMFEIFSRLNSGGVTLNPQEVRMSLFYSPFYEKVLQLNNNPTWRKFLGKKDPDIHMKEVEVLVRAFAMYEMHTEYRPPMRIFLNRFSEKAKKFDTEKIDYLTQLFLSFWACCEDLDYNSFKNERGRFVVSHFDAIFAAVCELITKDNINGRKIDPDSIVALKRDSEFSDASQQRTADPAHVQKRISKAKEYIILR